MQSKSYQDSVRFVPSTDYMEALVSSRTDATIQRRVIFSTESQTPPTCCAYSQKGDGFPCWHAVADICVKHGSLNVHRFIHERHLTAAWKKEYEEIEFPVPLQVDIDAVMATAAASMDGGTDLKLPVAIRPPRGRPPKDAPKRLRSFYESGFTHQSKKRKYLCSLCTEEGHTRKNCPLRQR